MRVQGRKMTIFRFEVELMEKLKLCPFCGKKPSVGFYEPIEGHSLYSVECGHCVIAPCTPDFPSKKEAIEAWNTRAED